MDTKQEIFHTFEVPDPVRIRKALRFIEAHFKKGEALNVLELGAAKGGVVDVLKDDPNIHCYAVDINPRSFAGIQIKQADLNNGIPDFGLKFNVIFAGELIEHIYDDRSFLGSCLEHLAPGGLLILTTPNLVFLANRFLMLCGQMPRFVYAPFHYHIYTKRILSQIVIDSGFEVVGLSSSHLLFSRRRHRVGRMFEVLGDYFPSLGAHLILCAKRPG